MHVIHRNSEKTIRRTIIILSGVIIFIINRCYSLGNLVSLFGYVATLASIFWLIWNYYIWRLPFIQKLCCVPDLNGRWEGYYRRFGEDSDHQKHTYILEIKQTYSTIHCSTFQDNGTSSAAVLAEVTVQPDERTGILFSWSGTRQPTEACTALKEENSAFHGTTNLIYSPAANERAAELSGEYFTDGKTKGEVYVQYVGEKLLKRFEK